jgi:hypothetical protein
VVDLRRALVNLGIELQLDGVGSLERFRVPGEGQRLRLDVDLELAGLDIGDRDGKVDEILFGISGTGSLGPEDCRERDVSGLCR